jgi:excisionase family DNA binding protein
LDKRYLGIKELAEYIGVKQSTVYAWVCYRKIPYVKVGRLVKFDVKRIDDWLKEKSIEVM